VNVDVESLLKNADKSPRTNRHPMPPPPAAAAAGAYAGAYAVGLPPPGLAVPPQYFPPGFPAGIAGVPAAALYGMGPYGGVAGPPPPRMGGGGGGGRRRRRRR